MYRHCFAIEAENLAYLASLFQDYFLVELVSQFNFWGREAPAFVSL